MIIYGMLDLQNVYAKTTWIDENIQDAGPTKHIRKTTWIDDNIQDAGPTKHICKNNMNWW